jgi:hypothetical protein
MSGIKEEGSRRGAKHAKAAKHRTAVQAAFPCGLALSRELFWFPHAVELWGCTRFSQGRDSPLCSVASHIIPAKAEIRFAKPLKCAVYGLDSRFRGNDVCFTRVSNPK